MTTRTYTRAQMIIGTLAIAAIGAVVLILALSPGSSSPSAPEGPNGYGAELACEQFVTQKLPGLTKFQDETFTGTSPTWTVTGTGTDPSLASLTLHYQCTVSIPDGTNWQLQNLQDLG